LVNCAPKSSSITLSQA